MYDFDRDIHWFPSILNMGKLGMIYPEGTKDNWVWKFAEVRKLSPEEQKDPVYEGNEYTLDMENAKQYKEKTKEKQINERNIASNATGQITLDKQREVDSINSQG